MSQFLQMGGYAVYVWTAYGVTTAVMVFNVWSAYRCHGEALNRARQELGQLTSERRPTVRQIS